MCWGRGLARAWQSHQLNHPSPWFPISTPLRMKVKKMGCNPSQFNSASFPHQGRPYSINKIVGRRESLSKSTKETREPRQHCQTWRGCNPPPLGSLLLWVGNCSSGLKCVYSHLLTSRHELDFPTLKKEAKGFFVRRALERDVNERQEKGIQAPKIISGEPRAFCLPRPLVEAFPLPFLPLPSIPRATIVGRSAGMHGRG